MPDHEESPEPHKRLNLCGVHLRRFRLEKHLTLADIQATIELDYGMYLLSGQSQEHRGWRTSRLRFSLLCIQCNGDDVPKHRDTMEILHAAT